MHTKKSPHRIAWAFAFGYFAFYAPYSALIKLVTEGWLPGIPAGMSGVQLLPPTIIGTVLVMLLFLTITGWWHYAQIPSAAVIAAGIGTGTIIATTTIAYTFHGVSIVFALLLMRGGVLILAPLVDLIMRRTVRWFCWAALALSGLALIVAALDVEHYQLPFAAAVNLVAYLSGYAVRLPAMTRLAKVDDRVTTRRFFVTEALVAMVSLAAFPSVVALLNGRDVAAPWRATITLWQTPVLAPALLIGATYAGLYVFGTLIYLDRRENTFCIPLNRGASLLAGVAAAYGISAAYHLAEPSVMQLVAAALMAGALVLLSPAHHLFEFARAAGKIVEERAQESELRRARP
jgi:hypothetical protein